MKPSRSPLELDRPLIMGILNVTPDSFSGGGRFTEIERAVAHAVRTLEGGGNRTILPGEPSTAGL